MNNIDFKNLTPEQKKKAIGYGAIGLVALLFVIYFVLNFNTEDKNKTVDEFGNISDEVNKYNNKTDALNGKEETQMAMTLEEIDQSIQEDNIDFSELDKQISVSGKGNNPNYSPAPSPNPSYENNDNLYKGVDMTVRDNRPAYTPPPQRRQAQPTYEYEEQTPTYTPKKKKVNSNSSRVIECIVPFTQKVKNGRNLTVEPQGTFKINGKTYSKVNLEVQAFYSSSGRLELKFKGSIIDNQYIVADYIGMGSDGGVGILALDPTLAREVDDAINQSRERAIDGAVPSTGGLVGVGIDGIKAITKLLTRKGDKGVKVAEGTPLRLVINENQYE